MTITDPGTIPGRNCENADAELWFPSKNVVGRSGGAASAARLCAGCPALDVCLEWALAMEAGIGASGRHGIYGGMTPGARARIARKRAAA